MRTGQERASQPSGLQGIVSADPGDEAASDDRDARQPVPGAQLSQSVGDQYRGVRRMPRATGCAGKPERFHFRGDLRASLRMSGRQDQHRVRTIPLKFNEGASDEALFTRVRARGQEHRLAGPERSVAGHQSLAGGQWRGAELESITPAAAAPKVSKRPASWASRARIRSKLRAVPAPRRAPSPAARTRRRHLGGNAGRASCREPSRRGSGSAKARFRRAPEVGPPVVEKPGDRRRGIDRRVW